MLQIQILNGKQSRSRSVGFFRSQLIWIYTVCKERIYPGSAWQGLTNILYTRHAELQRVYVDSLRTFVFVVLRIQFCLFYDMEIMCIQSAMFINKNQDTAVWISMESRDSHNETLYQYSDLTLTGKELHIELTNRSILKIVSYESYKKIVWDVTTDMCVQRRQRSVYTPAQSDRSLCCPPEEVSAHWLSIDHAMKTLIRFVQSDLSPLGALVRRYMFSRCGYVWAGACVKLSSCIYTTKA